MTTCGFNFDNTYIKLPSCLYTRLEPVAVAGPEIVILNEKLSAELGLDFSELSVAEQAALFSGNMIPKAAEPIAQAYAGHQFGYFTMLGDGRAIVCGEHVTPNGKRFDIQFKGSGRTPYSRRGDGRAALGPMLREYMVSEAMHSLGVPTTRGLAVVTTGEDVVRETSLPGAILTRVAASHIRVGTFEFVAAQHDKALIQTLLDYTINRHYPDLEKTDNKAQALLAAVMERQADLIIQWMRVGFIHGVMNTDNMTLSGETIDYGPCAFMDAYAPGTVFSSIDHMGRYAYANQPFVAQWNLARLAETLLPLINTDIKKAMEVAEETINCFAELYRSKWLSMMRAKLGLFGDLDGDEKLASDLLDLMHKNDADYTNTFRDLSSGDKPTGTFYQSKEFTSWYERWQARLAQNTKPMKSSLCLMKKSNPAIIPRNHKVEQTLEAASVGDIKPFHDMLVALQEPYNDSKTFQSYQSPPTASERVYKTFCGT